MSDPEKSETPAKPERHPAALSSEYHKAHKQLMLWSAILFIWEFVGIDLEKAKDAEGYAGALVKSIKSPQAVPWVLLALVIYFLFKCSTEWAQCHVLRRRVRFARADFISALVVSLGAVVLYAGQSMSRARLADKLSGDIWPWGSLLAGLVVGVFFGFSLTLAWILFARSPRSKPNMKEILILLLGPLLLTLVVSLAKLAGFPIRWTFGIVGTILGFLFAFGLIFHDELPVSTRRNFQRIAQKLFRLPKK